MAIVTFENVSRVYKSGDHECRQPKNIIKTTEVTK